MCNEFQENLIIAIGDLANTITATDAFAGHDATGGHVASLTEAVMGITAGLVSIASSIDNLADAVRESR